MAKNCRFAVTTANIVGENKQLAESGIPAFSQFYVVHSA